MIALIVGRVVSLNAPHACILTAGGVGYDVELSIPSFCQLTLDSETKLYTHMIVREDYQGLYGFIKEDDRNAFKKLIKITGVGAKMALAMLSAMSASELKLCVDNQNETALTRIPGVGKKTAQRLLIELKGKLTEFGADDMGDQPLFASHSGNQMQVIAETESALINLGYKEKEAQNAIKSVYTEGMDMQTLLRLSLKNLSGF